MKNKLRFLTASILLVSFFLVSGCGCRPKNTGPDYVMELEVWGFTDDRDALSEIFSNYKMFNRQIRDIKYRKFSPDTYKKELVEAMASGKGPDIFMAHNTWLSSFEDKMVPAPEDIFGEQKLRRDFVDVVMDDFFKEGKVYAVPLSVDSLGLYYNKDLFNEAGITSPPKTWNELLENVSLLTKLDNNQSLFHISRSGVALGTAYNINRSTDILAMIMIQNGTQMADQNGRLTFDRTSSGEGSGFVSPGVAALEFYTRFADIGASNYSWNPSMHYSVDAFSEGRTAMMFNYSWHMDTVSQKSPKLNFAVAEVPQFSGSGKANYANYWAYSVAFNKISQDFSGGSAGEKTVPNESRVKEAWKLIAYLTSKPELNQTSPSGPSMNLGGGYDSQMDPAYLYAKKTNRPAARRDILEIQKNDARLGAFASGNLIAKSFPQKDPQAVESILAEMIDRVNRGVSRPEEAVKSAVQKINQQSSF